MKKSTKFSDNYITSSDVMEIISEASQRPPMWQRIRDYKNLYRQTGGGRWEHRHGIHKNPNVWISRATEDKAGRLSYALKHKNPEKAKMYAEISARAEKKANKALDALPIVSGPLYPMTDEHGVTRYPKYHTGGSHQTRTIHTTPSGPKTDFYHPTGRYHAGQVTPLERYRIQQYQDKGHKIVGSLPTTLREIEPKSEKKKKRQEMMRNYIDTHGTKRKESSYKAWAEKNLKEMYEFVLEYLLNEGYADSYETADGIFQIMSEEWFAEIIEEGFEFIN